MSVQDFAVFVVVFVCGFCDGTLWSMQWVAERYVGMSTCVLFNHGMMTRELQA